MYFFLYTCLKSPRQSEQTTHVATLQRNTTKVILLTGELCFKKLITFIWGFYCQYFDILSPWHRKQWMYKMSKDAEKLHQKDRVPGRHIVELINLLGGQASGPIHTRLIGYRGGGGVYRRLACLRFSDTRLLFWKKKTQNISILLQF